MSTEARAVDAERRVRFGVLLIAIVCGFAVQGIATPGQWEQVVISALLVATLLLSLRVAQARPQVTLAIAVATGLLLALSIAEAAIGAETALPVQLANLLLVTLAPPAVVIGTVRTLRVRGRVTIEAVFGVLCLYLLLGMFFAALYGAIAHVDGAFFAHNATGSTARYLYFSFTTLTTVGYGDLTAASNLGHTLSVSEALLGQIYLVTVVSLIVGNVAVDRRRGGTMARPDRGDR
jgi:hypothetical protein